jgi:iron complex transport system substrate-binding protein
VSIAAADGTVTIKSQPDAIVSLSPTATEMLYAIGAGSQVKAVDSYSDYPKNAPHTKLSAYTPNVEAIVGYHPDLVVVSDETAQIVPKLAAFHIPVLELPAAANLAQEYQQFDQIGEATGHLTQAKAEVASIKTQLGSIVASVASHPTDTYYYELDQTYYSVTSDTFVGQLLSLLNLKSIADAATGAASSGGYPQLSTEYIISANPDWIFLADTLCCHQSAATVSARPGWSVMTAVKDHHIVGLNDDIASRWGPRVVDLLATIAKALKAGD